MALPALPPVKSEQDRVQKSMIGAIMQLPSPITVVAGGSGPKRSATSGAMLPLLETIR